ncbi:MAG: hypothetical protein IKR18_00335 [Bacteroidaceae bacterium]|nr:hypothetical protein [Bacteroidaceae bacterium]
MKKYLGLLAALLALASCSHDDIIISKPTVFTAVTEGSPTDGSSRVTLTGTSLSWNLGDQIRVVAFPTGGGSPDYGEYESISGGSSTTAFVNYSGSTFDGSYDRYIASFPAHCYSSLYGDNNHLSMGYNYASIGVAISTRQQYTPGSFDHNSFPMLAKSTSTDLSFINVAALLCFKITSSVDFVLDSLMFTEKDYYDTYYKYERYDSAFLSYDYNKDTIYSYVRYGSFLVNESRVLLNINEPLGTTPKDFYLCVFPSCFYPTDEVYAEQQKIYMKNIRLWGHKSDGTPVIKTFKNNSSTRYTTYRSTITNVSLNVTGYDS